MFDSFFRYPNGLFTDFDRLHNEMDRLFRQSVPLTNIRAVGRGAFPAINLGADAKAVYIFAFAPGIDAHSLEVSLDNGVLTIAGERKATAVPTEGQRAAYRQERFSGKFRRVLSLNETVDPERVEAHYQNGILLIVAPKHEHALPRRIEVK